MRRAQLFVCAGLAVLALAATSQSVPEAQMQSPPPYLRQWGGLGSGPGQFASPTGVAISAAGDVYVADQGNSRIQRFTSEGVYVSQWGGIGVADGKFANPTGIAVAEDGSVLVTELNNHRVQVFGPDGNFLRKWGNQGSQPGQFEQPYGIGVGFDGSVYVADTFNHRVQVFDSFGGVLDVWSGYGSGEGQFDTPVGIAVDPEGSVYISQTANGTGARKVQKRSSSGDFLLEWTVPAPQGVAADQHGIIFVVNVTEVHAYTRDGAYLTSWGAFGTDPGRFAAAYGIGTDDQGRIYVTETQNHRIQVFGEEPVQSRSTTWGRVKAERR